MFENKDIGKEVEVWEKLEEDWPVHDSGENGGDTITVE
jgi:hypothetical protein